MDLIEIKGKINTAICYARVVEDEAIEQMPTIDNLVVLAAVLDVPMDEIIVIDVNRTKQISA